MTNVRVVKGVLRVGLSRFDRFFGLLGDLEVPIGDITSAVAVEDGLGAVPGWRAPGLAWPGRVKVGTWRTKGERWYVVARRDLPTLVLTLRHDRWAGAVLSTPDAAELAVLLGEQPDTPGG